MKITRRSFNHQLLTSVLTVSLVDTLCKAEALNGSIRKTTAAWLAEVEEVSRGLKAKKVRQTEWQQQIESLFVRVEMKDLLSAIDFDRLSRKLKLPDDREAVIETLPLPPANLTEERSFSTFIYGLKKGRAIVPHCHKNMTSMHLVIGGEMRGWHFDRIADEAQHLIINPTMDKLLQPGEISTTSDDKDNIHWFRAESEVAFTFNIGVYGVDPAVNSGGRQYYVDAGRGEKQSDGSLRVRCLSEREAHSIYGKS
jgi:hypothetical protein